MAMTRRLQALRDTHEELDESRVAIRLRLKNASTTEQRKLLESLGMTRPKLEQCSIEIGLLEDAGELVRRYTRLQKEALENAEAATPERPGGSGGHRQAQPDAAWGTRRVPGPNPTQHNR